MNGKLISKKKFERYRDALKLPDDWQEQIDREVENIKVIRKHKQRRSVMGWLLNLIPFGKSLLSTGIMLAAKWFIRNIIQNKVTPDLLDYISATKDETGNYALGVETTELQNAARKTSVKWDDKAADLAVVITEELYKIKNK